MDPTNRNLSAFNHARWRVQSARHLLATHEAALRKDTPEWKQEQETYRDRLAMSEQILATFPEEWMERYPPEAAPG